MTICVCATSHDVSSRDVRIVCPRLYAPAISPPTVGTIYCHLRKAHIVTQATQPTQPTQGRAAHVSVIHTFEYVSASLEVGQGSTVLRLLSPAPRSVPETVY